MSASNVKLVQNSVKILLKIKQFENVCSVPSMHKVKQKINEEHKKSMLIFVEYARHFAWTPGNWENIDEI